MPLKQLRVLLHDLDHLLLLFLGHPYGITPLHILILKHLKPTAIGPLLLTYLGDPLMCRALEVVASLDGVEVLAQHVLGDQEHHGGAVAYYHLEYAQDAREEGVRVRLKVGKVVQQEICLEEDVELGGLHCFYHEDLVVRKKEEAWRFSGAKFEIVDGIEILGWLK